jgi:hypothetical protein
MTPPNCNHGVAFESGDEKSVHSINEATLMIQPIWATIENWIPLSPETG